ncbi:hypothetical protein CDAR_444791 [Caerostris darwini]|uniref:Uncharacterized protein n=1 Tax=Caerostris darwini TaxID=1538125 RepID=A0AAV4W673_9ARAC|nr:hypothetical protein CDAR_444791 [Caerostris darwini]
MFGVENPVFRGPRVEPAPARNVEVEKSRKCFEFCKAFWECSKMKAILQDTFAVLYLCGFGGISFLQRPCLRRCVWESRRIDFYFHRCVCYFWSWPIYFTHGTLV